LLQSWKGETEGSLTDGKDNRHRLKDRQQWEEDGRREIMGSEQFIWQHGDPIWHDFLCVIIRYTVHGRTCYKDRQNFTFFLFELGETGNKHKP